MGEVIANRYILHEEIGRGGMGVVYRATDRLTGQIVALKQVNAQAERMPFSPRHDADTFRLALAQEFKLLASMRHPNIISVLDYGFYVDNASDARLPYFTMELLRDPHTLTDEAIDLPRSIQLRLLVQLLQALAYLHRRGIVHRDLKPSNVLVVDNGDGYEVRTLDFGLSALTGMDLESRNRGAVTTGGTIAYMAPEVLMGDPASPSSDLYAVGVMAYELLLGRHPFDTGDIGQMITNVIQVEPEFGDLEPSLVEVLRRLMAKAPEDRFATAGEVLGAISKATNHTITQETAAMRESFLQSARLVGRDEELSQLEESLDAILPPQLDSPPPPDETQAAPAIKIKFRTDEQPKARIRRTEKPAALQPPRGTVWLVGGESGSGKSRLLDELRTRAMVKGAQVVRGQCVAEGGALYEAWTPALRWLCLTTPIEDEQAAILKPLIPDVGDLIGRNVPDAPIVAPQQGQARLVGAVERLLLSQQQPLVIVLEDLQWGNENLELLIKLHTQIADHPLLIVGSFRDEEAPDLPERLPAARQMRLKRLSEEQIAELSEAMIGIAGKNPSVIDLLKRETEGNIFFLVEVVRALAEEAGEIDRIGMITLPEHVLTGGVQRILQRRMERVPEWARPLLKLAAVAERQLDLPVMRQLARDYENVDLTHWLTVCADAAVLEVQDGMQTEFAWRFAHDKLREALLNEIDPDERRDLHAHIAHALESVYPDNVAQFPAIAHHWFAAGDPAKTLSFAVRAGDLAMASGANAEAKDYFELALEAMAVLETLYPDDPDYLRAMIDITIKLARVATYRLTDNVPSTLRQALTAAEKLNDDALRARILGSMGSYHFVQGHVSEAMVYFTDSIALGEQLGAEEVLLTPYNIVGRATLLEGDLPRAEALLTRGAALAEQFGDQELLAGSLAFLAATYLMMGRKDDGDYSYQRCVEVSEALGASRLGANLAVAGVGYVFFNALDEAEAILSRSEALAEQMQDFLPLYTSMGFRGVIAAERDDYDQADELLRPAILMAQGGGAAMYVPTLQVYLADVLIARGELDAALRMAENALALSAQSAQGVGKAQAHLRLARLYSQLGDEEQAEMEFGKCLQSHFEFRRQPSVVRTLYYLGQHYAQHGKLLQANAVFNQALDMAEMMHMPLMPARIRRAKEMLGTASV